MLYRLFQLIPHQVTAKLKGKQIEPAVVRSVRCAEPPNSAPTVLSALSAYFAETEDWRVRFAATLDCEWAACRHYPAQLAVLPVQRLEAAARLQASAFHHLLGPFPPLGSAHC